VPFEEYLHGFGSPDFAPMIGTRATARLASFGVERHVVVSLNGNRVTDLVVRSSRPPF